MLVSRAIADDDRLIDAARTSTATSAVAEPACESAGFVRRQGHPSRLAWKAEVADQSQLNNNFNDFSARDLGDAPPEGAMERPSAPRQRPADSPESPRALP